MLSHADPVFTDHSSLLSVIAGQHGVISRAQAGSCGGSDAAIRTRLSHGDWLRVLPGVFRVVQVPTSAAGRVYAASLWAGPGAVVSGAAAAWWWELTGQEPRTVEVCVPRHRQLRSRPGVVVVRRALPAEDQATVRRVRVAGRAFAALFGAVAFGPPGRAILDRALLRGLSLAEVTATMNRHPSMRGMAMARPWVAAAADHSAAASERLFARLMRGAGIDGWVVNRAQRLGGYPVTPDFRLARARLVVEIDGWAFHTDPDRFEHDRARQNLFVGAGYRVLRFTWAQLTERPDWVVDQVREVLGPAAPT